MKSKIVTSVFLGLLFPWSYFVFVTVGPNRHYDMDGNEVVGAYGISGFIEFNGVVGSVFIYLQATLACAFFVLIICSIYDFIRKKIEN